MIVEVFQTIRIYIEPQLKELHLFSRFCYSYRLSYKIYFKFSKSGILLEYTKKQVLYFYNFFTVLPEDPVFGTWYRPSFLNFYFEGSKTFKI